MATEDFDRRFPGWRSPPLPPELAERAGWGAPAPASPPPRDLYDDLDDDD